MKLSIGANVPIKIKTAKTVNSFKHALDKFLAHIPDTPPVTGYKRLNSNSLCDWVGHVQQVKSQMFREELQEQRITRREHLKLLLKTFPHLFTEIYIAQK